jgi:hypothetical protein
MSMNFAYKYLFHTVVSLTCCQMLRHGTDSFTSTSNEGMLRIFIALKIYRPWPGLNQRTLGPMASTITTRSLWATLA